MIAGMWKSIAICSRDMFLWLGPVVVGIGCRSPRTSSIGAGAVLCDPEPRDAHVCVYHTRPARPAPETVDVSSRGRQLLRPAIIANRALIHAQTSPRIDRSATSRYGGSSCSLTAARWLLRGLDPDSKNREYRMTVIAARSLMTSLTTIGRSRDLECVIES